MKLCVIIALLLLSGEALGECSHRQHKSIWSEECNCSHRPYELFWAEKYRDGGTIKITVADSVGCVAGFILDGRIGSVTQGRIRFLSLALESGESRLASPEEEERALRILSRVVDRYMSRAEQYERFERGCPERLSTEECRYSGWVLEALQKKGWR